MFAMLGAAQVIALLIVGGFTMPMLIGPTHRGGPLLSLRKVEFDPNGRPGVLVLADHRGCIAWLLRLFKHRPWTCLEVTGRGLAYHRGGIYDRETPLVPLADVREAKPQTFHPKFHIAAMAVIGFPMLTYGIVGRLSWVGFAEGFALVALCGALASAQQTNNLVITIDGRRKPLVLAFSTLSLSRSRTALTYADLCAVADRIMQLVIIEKSQGSRLKAQELTARAPEEKRTRGLVSLRHLLLRMFGSRRSRGSRRSVRNR